MPGTFNHKDPSTKRIAIVLNADPDKRYDPTDFDGLLPAEQVDFTGEAPSAAPTSSSIVTIPNGDLTEDDKAIVERITASKQTVKFQALYSGDYTAILTDAGTRKYPSSSEAIEGLCCILAYYTRDPQQIRRIASQSTTCRNQPKWQDRKDYAERAITHALQQVKESALPKAEPLEWSGDSKADAPSENVLEIIDMTKVEQGKIVVGTADSEKAAQSHLR